jgi:hypothetical protein
VNAHLVAEAFISECADLPWPESEGMEELTDQQQRCVDDLAKRIAAMTPPTIPAPEPLATRTAEEKPYRAVADDDGDGYKVGGFWFESLLDAQDAARLANKVHAAAITAERQAGAP